MKIAMRLTLSLLLLLAAAPASAQVRNSLSAPQSDGDGEYPPLPTQPQSSDVAAPQAGKVADSAIGRVGERQTRNQIKNAVPIDRLDGRIQNRVQSRIRNRIDRYYEPQANTTSPFVIAADQARAASRRRGR